MRRDVIKNLLVGHAGKQLRSVFFHQQRRFSHHITADAAPGGRLNRMASDAGNAVFIERALDLGILRERTGEKRRGVMTRFAVTRELNSSLRLQVLYVLLVERLAKRIAMRRLSPLRVRIGVTGAATSRGDKFFGHDKGSGYRRRIARRKRIWPKLEVVSLGDDGGVICRTDFMIVSIGVVAGSRAREHEGTDERQADDDGAQDGAVLLVTGLNHGSQKYMSNRQKPDRQGGLNATPLLTRGLLPRAGFCQDYGPGVAAFTFGGGNSSFCVIPPSRCLRASSKVLNRPSSRSASSLRFTRE